MTSRSSVPDHWTPDLVEEWFREAADTLKRLPNSDAFPGGHRSSMPDYKRDPNEAYGWDATTLRLSPADSAAIDRLDLVLDWSRKFLDDRERLILWGRSAGARWKAVCRAAHCGRAHAWRLWVAALVRIATTLNEERRAA